MTWRKWVFRLKHKLIARQLTVIFIGEYSRRITVKMALNKSGIVFRFWLLVLIASAKGTEPHCSRFPYEEALLEKMVRLEFKTEQMEKGIKETEENVKTELGKLHDERKGLNSFLQTLTQGIERMTGDLELNRKQNEAKFVRMSEDLRVFRNESLRSLTDSVKPRDILFRAKLTDSHTYSPNQVIQFQREISNEGGHYSTARSIFTAPFNGSYIFTTQICDTSSGYYAFAFMVDGVIAQTSRTVYPSMSILVVRLIAESRVSIESKTSFTLYSSANCENLFSGMLISG